MHQDYYELDNHKQAIQYIFEYNLGFSYGNALKYCVRAGRKNNNSAESDLNKALTYIVSAENEFSFIKRLIMRIFNSWNFNDSTLLSDEQISNIIKSIIKFDRPNNIAKMIVKYMSARGMEIKSEFSRFNV